MPGLIGMSVHTDVVYLRELGRPDPATEPDAPAVSTMRSVLRGLDFHRLTSSLAAGRSEAADEILREAIDSVQRAGADLLVLTANTIHTMLDDWHDLIRIPVLPISRATLAAARARGHRRLGLIGTARTVSSGLYTAEAAEFGCEIVPPSPAVAAEIDDLIQRRLIAGIATEPEAAVVLQAIAAFADEDVDAVVLGCTDLTLLVPHLQAAPLPLLDSTVLHARAARRAALTGELP